jgi:hypothetical protein
MTASDVTTTPLEGEKGMELATKTREVDSMLTELISGWKV